MKYEDNSPSNDRVSEPVQVYLKPDDQDRLRRLTDELGTSKSDVLRRGLRALENQLTDPRDHPALRAIGLGRSGSASRASTEGERRADASIDPARDHDRALADDEESSWTETGPDPVG